jgi:uncharacterized membrane protein
MKTLKFIKTFWWWNVLIDIALMIVSFINIHNFTRHSSSNKNDFIVLIITILLTFIHSIFLFVFFILKIARKEYILSIILLAHLIGLLLIIKSQIIIFFVTIV